MSTHLGFKLSSLGYQPFQRPLSKEENRLLSLVFKDSDEDDKGFLAKEDLKIAIVSLFGYKPSKYEAKQIMEKFGENFEIEDGELSRGITFGKFVEAMAPKLFTKDEDDEIRQTFMAFDTQCKGFLTIEDLRKVASQISPHLSAYTLDSAFKELDRDCDGRISYKDFDFMMKYGTES